MIDMHTEEMIALRDLPGILPLKRGKPFHMDTIYRWAKKGVGGARLETLQIGGEVYTSREAFERFSDQLNKDPSA